MRIPIHFGRTAMAAMATLLLPAALAAQTLTIDLSGGPSATVVAASPTGRQPLGRVSPGSPLNLNMSAINAGKGKRVEMRLDKSGTEPVVVLVPPGVTDPRCAAAQGDDDCQLLGVVPWGSAQSISINTTGATATMSGPDTFRRFIFGVDYNVSKFTKLDDSACNPEEIPNLESCEADDGGSGFGVLVEFALIKQASLGLRYSQSSYSVNQVYDSAILDHNVDVSMLDFYMLYRPVRGRILNPFISMGGSWFCNDSELSGPNGLLGNRNQSGLRFIGDLGAELRLSDRIGARVSAGLRTGGSRDNDTHRRFGLGITTQF